MIANVLSSLLFFSVSYAVISFQFQNRNARKGKWVGALVLVLAAFAIKLGYDMQSLPRSHYNILEISRHSTTLDIRRSFKRLSKIYHPDKQSDVGDEVFQIVKQSYDVLMDEEMRDVYNRFGSAHLEFDPRKDELKLISDIVVVYLFWAVAGYIMTIPAGARACRTWLMILGLAVMAVEVAFKLTETQLPDWMPEGLTEHELVWYLHACFPAAVAALRVLAESLYVDADQTSLSVLKEVYLQQKSMSEQLHQLQQLVEVQRELSDAPSQDAVRQEGLQLQGIQSRLTALRDDIDHSVERAAAQIDQLRQCSANPGANYYWIIFVLLYGSVYFLQ